MVGETSHLILFNLIFKKNNMKNITNLLVKQVKWVQMKWTFELVTFDKVDLSNVTEADIMSAIKEDKKLFNLEKGAKEKAAVDAWKIYRDHLYDVPRNYQDPNYQK